MVVVHVVVYRSVHIVVYRLVHVVVYRSVRRLGVLVSGYFVGNLDQNKCRSSV